MIRDMFNESLLELVGGMHKIIFEVTENVKPDSITQVQYNILEYLYVEPKKNLSEIAGCMYLSMPNASREVRKLLEKGLIKKEADPADKRITIINLTTEGKQIMSQAFAGIFNQVNEKYKDLTDDDLKELVTCIQTIVTKLNLKRLDIE